MTLFQANLEWIRNRLPEVIASANPLVNEMIQQPVQAGGKLIRPRLVLATASLFTTPDPLIMDVAVAVECIHTASLVHDDIIDQACLRRGEPSALSLFGPQAAVLIGDNYFASAFQLLSDHGMMDILSDLCQVVRDMCSGELKQDLSLFNPHLSEADYFTNIFGKTASLFAGACRAGAIAAGASAPNINQLGQFGENLGYAYQIADDILDLVGNEEDLGKPAGSDLKNGIITLPVIRALAVAPEREWLSGLIVSGVVSDDDFKRAVKVITRCGAIEYARAAAIEHSTLASRLVSHFRPGPARDYLMDLAASLVNMALPAPPQLSFQPAAELAEL